MPTNEPRRSLVRASPLIHPGASFRPARGCRRYEISHQGRATAARLAAVLHGLLTAAVALFTTSGLSAVSIAAPPVQAPRPPAASPSSDEQPSDNSVRPAVPGLLWRTQLKHNKVAARVTSSHVSPDGCLLAVGTTEGNVFLVETATGQPAGRTLAIPTNSAKESAEPAAGTMIQQVQFDSTRPGLLHVLTDRSVIRWNIGGQQPALVSVTPLPLAAPASRSDADLRVARQLSADGTQVVVTRGNAPQLVLSGRQLDSQQEIAESIEIDDCQTLPGTGALFASRFGRLYRWNLQSGERLWKTRLEARIRGFTFDGPGRRIVALADYVGFQLVDPGTGDVLDQLPDPERRAGNGSESVAVAVSPDGTFFARGAADGSLELWDHITGLRLYQLRGHDGPIQYVRFQADGRQLLSIGREGTVLCHDLFSADFFLTAAETTAGSAGRGDAPAANPPSPPQAAPARADTAATGRAGQYWESLASPDGQTACGAALALADDSTLAIAIIEHPPSPVPEIRRLIAQLGSPLFVRRREAYRRLRELALIAEEELQQVAGSTGSVEVASRIRRLLDRLQGPSRAAQREQRQLARERQMLLTVRVLQWAGTPAARRLLERIADGRHSSTPAAARDAQRALQWLRQSDSERSDSSQNPSCTEQPAVAAPPSATD